MNHVYRLIVALLLAISSAAHADSTIEQLLEFQPDADRNSVRDDVDVEIAALFSEEPSKAALATAFAANLQRIAQSKGNPEYARELVLSLGTLQTCWQEHSDKSIEAIVVPLVLNTYGVSISYLEVRAMVQQVFGSIGPDEIRAYADANRTQICP